MNIKQNNNVLLAISIATLMTAPARADVDTNKLIGLDLDKNRSMVESAMSGRNYMVEVDTQGKIVRVIDSGANGSGTDFNQLANQDPAQKKSTTSKNLAKKSQAISSVVTSATLPTNYGGQEAIDRLGKDLPKVASNYGFSPEVFKETLLNDTAARIDANNQMLYLDHSSTASDDLTSKSSTPEQTTAQTPVVNQNPQLPIASIIDLAKTFNLHSKPGASKTIYLDFDGHLAEDTAWSSAKLLAPAFDTNGNPAAFDDNEKTAIINAWSRVAEDYAAFDVDVTTEAPASDDVLIRTSDADRTYGTRVVITSRSIYGCTCGGVAYVGVIDRVNNTYYSPAWVFYDGVGFTAKGIAEAASHEAGHTLGLFHDAQSVNGTIVPYYRGHGSGETGWAPIMGVGYYQNVTQWNAGDYPGATNKENDLSIMASHGLVSRADDVGNQFSNASSLTNTTTGTLASIENYGVIETNTDVDMFTFSTAGGAVTLAAKPLAVGPNLDINLKLYQQDGTLIQTDAKENLLSASINTTLPKGIYYLAVTNSGRAAVGSDYGYTTYGSMGQYAITGSYPTQEPALPPKALISKSTASGVAPLPVTFSANNSVGNGNITSYKWTFGDGTTSDQSNVLHTYATPGSYNASLLITNEFGLTGSDQTTITVTAPENKTVHQGSSAFSIMYDKRKDITTIYPYVYVVDNNNMAVMNASVKGAITGDVNKLVNSVSNYRGWVQLRPVSTSKRHGSATLKLTDIQINGYTYDPTQNKRQSIPFTW